VGPIFHSAAIRLERRARLLGLDLKLVYSFGERGCRSLKSLESDLRPIALLRQISCLNLQLRHQLPAFG